MQRCRWNKQRNPPSENNLRKHTVSVEPDQLTHWRFLYIWSNPTHCFGPHHAKTCILAYTDSEGPDHPAHSRSLIRPSLSANRILGYYIMYEQMTIWYYAHVQDDLNLRIFRLYESTFSLDAAQITVLTLRTRLHVCTCWSRSYIFRVC